MKNFIIESMNHKIVLSDIHEGQAMIEAQKKSNEWNVMVSLKNSKGKLIRNISPSGYIPQ